MAKKYLSPLNLLNLTSDPGTAAEGDFYWNSSTNRLRIYFDGAWADVSSNTAFTNAANTFTTAQTITPATSVTGLTINAASSAKGLIVKANATTPGNLQEWQNSAGTALAYFASNGQLYLTQHTSIIQGKGITWNNGDNYITGLSGYHIQFTTYDGTSGQNEAMRIMGGSIASGGARVGIGSTAPGSKLQVNTAATGEVGLIVRGIASQTADLIQAQNSAGSVVFKVSPTGVINAGGATTIGNILNFSDPGIGVETKFNFLRATDSAWLAVNEYASDQTYYEFGMSDNPGSGDYYQWRFDEWTAPGHGWMPLQIGAYITRFIAPSITQYGNIALNPYNTPFATVNAAATSAANYTVSRYAPTNGTSYSLNKDTGTGTGTVTLNTQSYTGTNIRNYWIEIEAGATTFKWGIDSSAFGGTIATGVSITGSAQTLDNGLQVTLSTTGHVAGDRWSWQSSPRRTIAIGGSPITGAMQIIYPSTGLIGSIIRGASGQTASLQEWQNNSATALAYVSASGNFFIPGIRDTADTGAYINMQASTSGVLVNTRSAANKGLVVKGSTSQSENLTEWQNSSGTILGKITSAGYFGISNLVATNGSTPRLQVSTGTTYNILIEPVSTTTVGLVIKGSASQTGNLQEWQDSAASVKAAISSAGYGTFSGITATANSAISAASGNSPYLMWSSGDGYRLQIFAKAANAGIVFNSVDASILDFQMAGTSRATLDASGNLTAASFVKTSGTSSQFLKADGSVDSSTYLTTGTAASTYLPLTGGTISSNLTITGDLVVNGTTTNLNSTNLVIEDKNIILGDVTTPSNTTADGGGITLKGATDKTFNWVNSTGYWTSNVGIEASSIIRTGGTSSQFLKADGSVDSSTYLTTGTASSTYLPLAGGTLTGQLISTLANSTSDGGGQIYLNGATGNRIDFNVNGVAAPAFTTRSVGTKIVLYPAISASAADYALGIEGSTLWFGVPSTSQQFKWYAGTTNIATLAGTGALTLSSSATATSFIPSGSTVPTNGMYLPSANTLGLATNSTSRIQINSIGETSIGGTPSGGTTLAILRSATGSTSMYGIYSTETAASDVTSLYTSIRGRPRTAAASFTLNSAVSFESNDIVKGAGSTVTNHIHYYVNATTTSASNVYGFRSDLNAAANVYNLYMNGTAANYFAGQTAIGSAAYSMGSGGVAQMLGVTSSSATNIGIVVRGAASQTADLQQWQDSSGAILAKITSTGAMTLAGAQGSKFIVDQYGTLSLGSSRPVATWLYVNPQLTTDVGTVIRGAASQTADLQQWQTSAGTSVATMSAAGAFTAITKSFDIPHPTKENMRLRYGSLEGPENGVYVRGRSKEKTIELPDYWIGLVDEDTITVNLTAIGSGTLYVKEIINNTVIVGGTAKEFFFTVFGERKDVDKLIVEY